MARECEPCIPVWNDNPFIVNVHAIDRLTVPKKQALFRAANTVDPHKRRGAGEKPSPAQFIEGQTPFSQLDLQAFHVACALNARAISDTNGNITEGMITIPCHGAGACRSKIAMNGRTERYPCAGDAERFRIPFDRFAGNKRKCMPQEG
jgi:hypothetical protein